MNFLKCIVLACLFAFIPLQCALGEESAPTPVESGGFFQEMSRAVEKSGTTAEVDLKDGLKKAGMAIAATVKDTALQLTAALGLMYLFYEVLQFLSGKSKSMLQVLFDVGIPCIFAALFIKGYPEMIAKFEGLLDVFRNLGGVPGKTGGPFSAILKVYTAAVGNVTTAIQNAFSNIGDAFNWKDVLLSTTPKLTLALVDLLVTTLFALAILVLLLIGVSEVLGLLLIGPFLFAVGVALGPLMIAGLATPWTRDYFTKWVQFLVISAGLTGVINVIFIIAATMMEKSGAGTSTGDPTAVGLVIMAILILTINSMISQAPSIASALFPGHVGVSKSSGGAVVNAGKKAMGGMAMPVKGAWKGAGNTVKFAKSMGKKKDGAE